MFPMLILRVQVISGVGGMLPARMVLITPGMVCQSVGKRGCNTVSYFNKTAIPEVDYSPWN